MKYSGDPESARGVRLTSAGLAYLIGILAVGSTLLLTLTLPVAGTCRPAADTTDMTLTFSIVELPQPTATSLAVEHGTLGGNSLSDGATGDNFGLIGGDFAITTLADGQYSPAVTWNAITNEYLVVWVDIRSGPSGAIYGQRVASSGALRGSNFAISTNSQTYPAVACNAAVNEYLVVWVDFRWNPRRINGQRVEGNGVLLGDYFTFPPWTGYPLNPTLTGNTAANEYLVVWPDSRVHGQRVGSGGALLGAKFAITTAAYYQESPVVAWNAAANEYLVVWVDGLSHDIYAQKVGGNGVLLGGNFIITTAPEDQNQPTIAWNAAINEYLVVWQDDRSGPTYDIYGQRVESSGELLGTSFAISAAANNQTYPAMSWNRISNEYLVIWQDQRNNLDYPSPDDIYGQRIKGDGSLLGGDFPISTAANYQLYPSVAWNAATNEYLAVWVDLRNGRWNVYGQRIGYPSIPTPTPTPTKTSTPTRTPTRTPTPTRSRLYVPLILRRWPPIPDAPTLNAIALPGANPSYTVSWNASYLADTYILEQATSASFSDATQVYAGTATSKIIRSEGIATYHYRVKARNAWGDSFWSNVQAVEVRWEREPNNAYTEATGPILSGRTYYGYPSDEKDYFNLFMPTHGTIVVELTGHVSASAEHKPQLLLYYRVPQDGGQVKRVYEPPYRLEYTGDPGQYYIYVFTPTESVSGVAPYTLQATFP